MTEAISDPGARLADQRPIEAFVHDVNNPLAVALMRVALAKRRLQRGDGEPEQLLGGLSEVESQIRRVAALVATLELANRHDGPLRWPPRVAGGSQELDDDGADADPPTRLAAGDAPAAASGRNRATEAHRQRAGRRLTVNALIDAAQVRCDRARALLDGPPAPRDVLAAGRRP